MWDERQQSQQSENGHLHGQPGATSSDIGAVNDAADMLPVDLEPIHEQLLRDSDGWSRRLPEAGALASYARVLPTGTAAVLSPPPTVEDDGTDVGPIATQSTTIPAVPHELSTHGHTRRLGPGRTLLGLAAALAIVALMAVVFASMAPGRSPAAGKPTASVQPTNTVIPTATPRPAYGPVRGSWQPIPALRNQPDPPTVAPSDPSVIYETVFTGSTTSIPSGQDSVLRRSNDGGKTWHNLVLPKPAFANVLNWGPGGALISPEDPNFVIVGVRSQLSYSTATTCPTTLQTAQVAEHGGILAYGALDCSVQYVSRDGGNTWTPISVAGIHVLPVDGFDALYAQDGRYYATFDASQQPAVIGGYRVVSSTDGVHWALVDSAPLAAAKRICGFIAVPTGSTIYATTNTGTCGGYNSPPNHLWRSDDAGLHWNDLGQLEGDITDFVAAEQGPNDPQPTLYMVFVTFAGSPANGSIELTMHASTDGGYTWEAAPRMGIPAGFQAYEHIQGTLSDGSVVMEYMSTASAGQHDPATLGFYAWHAGDGEWHQVAPPLTIADRATISGGWMTFFVTPKPGIHGTVWYVRFDPTAQTYAVESYQS